jgi:ubiquinone/menaquinone biosynthesis C-methylase UbiE
VGCIRKALKLHRIILESNGPNSHNHSWHVGIMDSKSHLHKVKHFHDLDASQYKKFRYHSNSCEGLAYITRKKLVLASVNINSGKVLDIGCGPGVFTEELLKKKLQVFSTDLSIEMIKEAKRQLNQSPVSKKAYFNASDASNLCFLDNKIDCVLCIGVLCYVKNYHAVLSEIYRVLKPEGITILQINKITWPAIYKKFVPLYRYIKKKITSKSYAKLNFEFNFFSYHNFINDLEENGLQIVEVNYYDFRIPFIDILLPALSLKLGKIMFKKRQSKLFRFLAQGVLVKAIKNSYC